MSAWVARHSRPPGLAAGLEGRRVARAGSPSALAEWAIRRTLNASDLAVAMAVAVAAPASDAQKSAFDPERHDRHGSVIPTIKNSA